MTSNESGPDRREQDAPHPTTVLLVEDHASYRQALATLLESDGNFLVVAQASTAEQAVSSARRVDPALAIIDLDLAGADGVDVLIDIRANSPGTACVVLSALRDDATFGRAVEAGAAAALHKSMDIDELLGVLQTVAAGSTVLPPLDTSRWLRAWDRTREQGRHTQLLAERLTPREREILARLAGGASHTDIASQLDIAPDTVQTHIRNLMGKLAVHSRLEAVVKALQLGLVDPSR